MADFFVLCSAESDVQIRAIMDAVEGGMEEKGVNAWHRESGSPHWVLLDYVDVVLHIFHTSTRTFYNLEKLWGDAKAVRVNDDAPVRKPRTTKPKRSTARPATRKRVKAS
jgi:ribosome-associated protein